MKKIRIGLLVLFSLILLTGCVPNNVATEVNPAGFFSGLWHGWIAPFSLILSFFNPELSIYQVYNTGFTYNLGFYIAIISGFGTIALERRK
ncbi:hypothetical protein [Erysipelothrix anatis]|uniref:hypothetical protein n=1 Tax=Erysipelothrix anatis TaxID=2683713 RepID=UPI00135C6C0E|nr:hypothetical protein [Erysipelothrix anatis]